MKNVFKMLIGLLLVFFYHVPRLIYQALLVSYTYVFNRHENLTADPNEHLKRARKLLRGQNSQMLYAALEVRFAIERMTQRELIFAEKATSRSLKEYSPVKKVKSLRRLDPDTEHPHKIIFIDDVKGIEFDWGNYKPLDLNKVTEIQGRLGDLLHPKDGLRLGISNDPYYQNTRKFLTEAVEYLSQVVKDNSPFFAFDGLENFQKIRVVETEQ